MKIALVANTSWYLWNFRRSLIDALQKHGVEVLTIAPDDEYSEKLRSIGTEFIGVRLGRKTLNPAGDLGFLSQLLKIYRNIGPDIVFHNTPKPVIYGSVAARCAGIPRIVNMIPGLGFVFSGDGLARRFLRPLVKQMYKLSLAHSHVVLFQNPDDKAYFEEHGIVDPAKAQVTFGSGVDLDYFSPRDPRPDPSGCTFLLLGRMLWDKGIGEFVDAASAIKTVHPDARFQLLGIIDRGNPSHIEPQKLNEWHAKGIVEYLGETDDVRPMIGDADVVVLPSYYREGIPRSLLEAMAMRKPIITTDMPGCRLTVVESSNGFLVPPRDTTALKNAMLFLIEHPEERVRMGAESRKLAEERFDVKRVNGEVLRAMGIL